MAALLTSRLAELNPFSKSNHKDEAEDQGEETSLATIGGGGHGARKSNITKTQLRVSNALKAFIVKENILGKHDVGEDDEHPTGALQELVAKPHINVPSYVTDRSYPLSEYFISSSHNTYLTAHQLFGSSTADSYQTVLHAGARCVEIDAWDNEDDPEEPKVTHGYTLVSNIPFRAVCETIRDCVDKEVAEAAQEQSYRSAPILLSLENHCDVKGQLRLVQIMKEVWGDRLLSEAIREKGHEEQRGGDDVTLAELGSKIVVIVEHILGSGEEAIPEDLDDDDDSFDEESEEERKAKEAYAKKKKSAPTTVIIPELADLGVYAQSVKPSDNSWFEEIQLKNGPHHHLINVSETGLLAHLPANSEKVTRHNALHLMRVFPKGTRISSKNLKPVTFWGIGAQICALNWQTFGASMQINEALFSGSDGYVLKPPALRAGGAGKLSNGRKKKLTLHVAGATDIPVPEGREADDIKPYVTCVLLHPDNLENDPPKRKTSPYKQHKLSFMHRGENPPPTDAVFDEKLEWEYEDNDLTFLRILVKSDDSFSSNPVLAVTASRLLYVVPGWSFIRLLDLKGRETKCSILVKFDIQDI